MTAIRLWLGKDVRRLAVWLVAWGGVLAARTVSAFDPPIGSLFLRAGVYSVAWVATSLLFVLLVTLVVLEDPALDPKAFWPTRPISARQLCVAKGLLVLVLLVLPAAAIDVLEVVATGVDRHLVLLAVPESALDWAAWGALVMMLAALSTSLVGVIGGALRLGLTLLLVLVGAGVIAYVHGQHPLRWFDFSWQDGPEKLALDASRAIAARVGVLVAALGVTAWTFARRERRRVWTVVSAAFVALLVAWSNWSWTFVSPPAPVAAGAAPAVTVSLDRVARVSSDPSFGMGIAPHEKSIQGHFTLGSLAPPLAVELGEVQGMLRYPVRNYPISAGATIFERGWDTRTLQALLPGARILNDDGGGITRRLLSMPDDDFAARRTTPGRISVTATLAIRRYAVTAEAPLAPGARIGGASDAVTIESMTLQNGTCMVFASATKVSLLLAPGTSTVRRMGFMRFDPTIVFVLRNRRRGEVLLPEHLPLSGFGWSRSRVDKVNWLMTFNGTLPNDRTRSILDDDWLRDADLVRVEAVSQGEVGQQIEVDDFAVDPEATVDPAPRAAARSVRAEPYDPS